MGLFRRKGKGDSDQDHNIAPGSKSESQPLNPDGSSKALPKIDKKITEKAQLVMKEHLDVMRDVVMKIRNEEGYAKSMYANCPRLQHLLDRNPDLRPVFEDPRLVRINFETVYKEAGGILPEDEEAEALKKKNPSLIMRIANHPIFKILKVLIVFKKILGCVTGAGIGLITSFWSCCTDCCTDCCCEDAVEEVGEIDDMSSGSENEYGLDLDAPMDENQRALNTAADYMEDPEVQEQMQRLLEDPDGLDDAIENDTELRALRDSNPLCAELMHDPETMKILTDPDNLRALGEAPAMIELDFNDPTGFNPEADFIDIEAGEFEGLDASGGDFSLASGSMDGLEAYEADYEENDIQFEMEDDPDHLEDGIEEDSLASFEDEPQERLLSEEAPAAVTVDTNFGDLIEMDAGGNADHGLEVDTEGLFGEEGGAAWEDDIELEQQDLMDADNNDGAGAANRKNRSQKEQDPNAVVSGKNKGMRGVVASLGVAATEVIASQIVGEVFGTAGDLFGAGGGMGGGMGPDLGGFDAAANQADGVINEDVIGITEDTMDDVDDEKDDVKTIEKEHRRNSRMCIDASGRRVLVGGMGASGAAAAAAAATSQLGKLDEESSIDDGLESCNSDEEEEFSDEEAEEEQPKEKKKNKLFGAFKNLASETLTAAKEDLAARLLGDDLAEMLVEKQEERANKSDSESESDVEGEEKEKPKKKRFRELFRRKKEEPTYDVSATLLQNFKVEEDSEEFDPEFYAQQQTFPPTMEEIAEEEEEYDPNVYAEKTFEANAEEEEYNPEFYAGKTFEANEEEVEYNSNFYAEHTFEANEEEEEFDPNFYAQGTDNDNDELNLTPYVEPQPASLPSYIQDDAPIPFPEGVIVGVVEDDVGKNNPSGLKDYRESLKSPPTTNKLAENLSTYQEMSSEYFLR